MFLKRSRHFWLCKSASNPDGGAELEQNVKNIFKLDPKLDRQVERDSRIKALLKIKSHLALLKISSKRATVSL